jgi:hypothetical protein
MPYPTSFRTHHDVCAVCFTLHHRPFVLSIYGVESGQQILQTFSQKASAILFAPSKYWMHCVANFLISLLLPSRDVNCRDDYFVHWFRSLELFSGRNESTLCHSCNIYIILPKFLTPIRTFTMVTL